MPPQKSLKIWVLLHAIWKVKYQDSILNKIISCGYNDAWFVTLRSKVTTALEETNEETIYLTTIWELIKHDELNAIAL